MTLTQEFGFVDWRKILNVYHINQLENLHDHIEEIVGFFSSGNRFNSLPSGERIPPSPSSNGDRLLLLLPEATSTSLCNVVSQSSL